MPWHPLNPSALKEHPTLITPNISPFARTVQVSLCFTKRNELWEHRVNRSFPSMKTAARPVWLVREWSENKRLITPARQKTK